MDFTGKTVLVTGSSRGIGREIAKQFADNGAQVAIHYNRNEAMAKQTLEMLAGTGHIIVQADISDAASVKTMVDGVVSEMGKLDIAVNNAGMFADHKIAEVSYDDWCDGWQRTIQTNLVGAANVAFCAAQHMIPAGGGRIVNVSSRGAFRGEPNAPAYGASKAGMNAMAQSLARALGPHNIFVTTVAPGWVETDMAREAVDGPNREAVLNQSPLHRIARPDEIAYTVLFLASEGTDFLTGAIVDANGASYLRT